jgi:CBS domain-containing protein
MLLHRLLTEEATMVTVEHLMKRDLITVTTGTSVVEAAKLMKENNVGSVLVTLQGRVVGIVTESDVVKKFVGAEKTPYFLPVDEIMSSPVVGIEAGRPITEAADLMNRHRTRHLGVTQFGTFVGVVSVRDFLRPVAVDDL